MRLGNARYSAIADCSRRLPVMPGGQRAWHCDL